MDISNHKLFDLRTCNQHNSPAPPYGSPLHSTVDNDIHNTLSSAIMHHVGLTKSFGVHFYVLDLCSSNDVSLSMRDHSADERCCRGDCASNRIRQIKDGRGINDG